MSSYNAITLVGRLGADPEIRYSADGNAFGSVRLATSETWKDKATGEKKERTDWHRIKVAGRLAEICGEYLKKGDLALFAGQLRTDKFTDKEGNEKYDTHVRADIMQMLGTKRDAGETKADKPQHRAPVQDFETDPDSIPF